MSSAVERLEAVAGPHVRHAQIRFRTTNAFEDDSEESSDDMDDDTVELALTEQEMLALSRAAEEEHAETSVAKSALITIRASHGDQSVRSRRWALVLSSSVVIGIVVGVVWGVVADNIPTVPTRARPAATRSIKSLNSPVQFSNPSDASEVFEFPAGTSDDRVRQSVAAKPLQRAHDRRGADAAKSN